MARRRKRAEGPVRITRPVYLRLPVALADEIRDLSRARGWFVNRWVEGVLERELQKIRGPVPMTVETTATAAPPPPASVTEPADEGSEDEAWIPPNEAGAPRTRTRF